VGSPELAQSTSLAAVVVASPLGTKSPRRGPTCVQPIELKYVDGNTSGRGRLQSHAPAATVVYSRMRLWTLIVVYLIRTVSAFRHVQAVVQNEARHR
jgi:hypothetical protein